MRRGKGLRRTGGLKPGKPLVAKTELVRYTPLRNTSGLNPGRGLRSTPFRPQRPAVVTPEERRARRLVLARSQKLCEGCGQPGRADYSHRVGEGVGGPWCPANALRLHRAEHEWAHQNRTEARALGWILRSTDDYRSFPAWTAQHGWVLLDVDGGWAPTDRRAA